LIRTGRITFVTTALDFSRTQPARQERTRAEGRPSADVSRTRKATGSAGFLAGMDARLLLHLAWRGNMRPMPIQLQRHGNRRSGRWKARQPRRSTPITHRRRPSCRRSDSRFVADWLSRDPIEEHAFTRFMYSRAAKAGKSGNDYHFLQNAPVASVDALGLFQFDGSCRPDYIAELKNKTAHRCQLARKAKCYRCLDTFKQWAMRQACDSADGAGPKVKCETAANNRCNDRALGENRHGWTDPNDGTIHICMNSSDVGCGMLHELAHAVGGVGSDAVKGRNEKAYAITQCAGCKIPEGRGQIDHPGYPRQDPKSP